MRTYTVYILASQRNGTLYVGVTGDLSRRVWQHKEGLTPGVSTKHGVIRLVWYEDYPDVSDAIVREKRLKRWRRAWKLRLIEANNPQWLDLHETFNS